MIAKSLKYLKTNRFPTPQPLKPHTISYFEVKRKPVVKETLTYFLIWCSTQSTHMSTLYIVTLLI